ncbi:MAG: hypothetical protein RI900_1029 [Actinomycetota bacterium]|jgi:hypothetical protein
MTSAFRLRSILGLLLIAALALLTACGGDGVVAQPQWGALPDDEVATYEYVVPYGTSVRVDQGQKVDLMPSELDVKVGESLRIKNEDGRDYMVGPFFVAAGRTLSMRFTFPGELSGICTLNANGKVVIRVSE